VQLHRYWLTGVASFHVPQPEDECRLCGVKRQNQFFLANIYHRAQFRQSGIVDLVFGAPHAEFVQHVKFVRFSQSRPSVVWKKFRQGNERSNSNFIFRMRKWGCAVLVLVMCTRVSNADESIFGLALFVEFDFTSNTSKAYCTRPLRTIRSQLSSVTVHIFLWGSYFGFRKQNNSWFYTTSIRFLVILAKLTRNTHCLFFLKYLLFSLSSFSRVHKKPSLRSTPTIASKNLTCEHLCIGPIDILTIIVSKADAFSAVLCLVEV